VPKETEAASEDFQAVAVRIVEAGAAAAVVVVDLAGAAVEGIGPVGQAGLVGALTSLVGGPYLLWLLGRRTATR
jgi:iron complex transport system permease protein